MPDHIEKPEYYSTIGQPDMFKSMKPEIKLDGAVAAMRQSCQLAANILEKCSKILKVM